MALEVVGQVAFPDEPRLLPPDSVLLPLAEGRLLVSRSHAIFCRIPGPEVAAVQAALRDPSCERELSQGLVAELTRHGFGMPPRPAPPASPSVQLQLTNECNLNCAYCCTDSGIARANEVKRDQFFQVVDEARSIFGAATRFGLLGGEPFFVPWAIELAEYICELGSQLPSAGDCRWTGTAGKHRVDHARRGHGAVPLATLADRRPSPTGIQLLGRAPGEPQGRWDGRRQGRGLQNTIMRRAVHIFHI